MSGPTVGYLLSDSGKSKEVGVLEEAREEMEREYNEG